MTRKFNEKEVNDIMYEDGIWSGKYPNQKPIYKTIEQETVYVDTGKGYEDIRYVIHEIDTDLYFQATLCRAEGWDEQSEVNSKVVWNRVIPYEVMVTKFRIPTKSDLRDIQIDKIQNEENI